ncbi:hypothetical protein G4V39_09610 [Thermosulfuriphilus ammonigenes]|uniref:Uncharacterized protein n=1 Tax=Thermosulfuriphilus ammonigenes TaxID=1936021 RepID=A0A6G7PYB4_9BACT|nr:hypothetical protein [Thermosulfuriphilus ammonigenes]MBA2849441.1 hypothetical protein [Thermosulfuriphilus ammonigenes]QIJ72511.1 hypothetical protein G4V39_09610 [Thermosulfuriphilus ammonigenes]HFB83190.1 hypothetical protein [Thermodesulfatator sp.]
MSRPEPVQKFSSRQEARLSPEDEVILKIVKEIIIKFIEMGRVSPASFEDVFKDVYRVIKETVGG